MKAKLLVFGSMLLLPLTASADLITTDFTVTDLTKAYELGNGLGQLPDIEFSNNLTGTFTTDSDIPFQDINMGVSREDNWFSSYSRIYFLGEEDTQITVSYDTNNTIETFSRGERFRAYQSTFASGKRYTSQYRNNRDQTNIYGMNLNEMFASDLPTYIDENGYRIETFEYITIDIDFEYEMHEDLGTLYSEPALPEFMTYNEIMENLLANELAITTTIQYDSYTQAYDGWDRVGDAQSMRYEKRYTGFGAFAPQAVSADVSAPGTLAPLSAGLFSLLLFRRRTK